MTQQTFNGDLQIIETKDGGDCVLQDGIFNADHGFGTAFYLSLFGGNKADSGKVKNRNTWWGNTLGGIQENEKNVSRFQNFICSKPMTVKNIKDAETMAQLDLKWAIDEKIADAINVSIRSENVNKIRLFISALKDGKEVHKAEYGVSWEAMLNGV